MHPSQRLLSHKWDLLSRYFNSKHKTEQGHKDSGDLNPHLGSYTDAVLLVGIIVRIKHILNLVSQA